MCLYCKGLVTSIVFSTPEMANPQAALTVLDGFGRCPTTVLQSLASPAIC
jgi:hypothetical protein